MTRPKWDTYFLGLAALAATRATCPRLHVGAVVVKDKRVLSTGYNGNRSGEPHCDHPLNVKCPTAVHAEENALEPVQWRSTRNSLVGATLYLTHSPCAECHGLIIGAGIKRVVYLHPYKLDLGDLENHCQVEHLPVNLTRLIAQL